jgi:hypothetical protein
MTRRPGERRDVLLCCGRSRSQLRRWSPRSCPLHRRARQTAARRRRARCPRVQAYLLAANSRAEVYEAPEGPRSTELAVFGCAYRNGRAFQPGGVASQQSIGGPGGESGVLDATLASTVVAYANARAGFCTKCSPVRARSQIRRPKASVPCRRLSSRAMAQWRGPWRPIMKKAPTSSRSGQNWQPHARNRRRYRSGLARGLRQHDVLDAGGIPQSATLN